MDYLVFKFLKFSEIFENLQQLKSTQTIAIKSDTSIAIWFYQL
jgi:hypothetical protein